MGEGFEPRPCGQTVGSDLAVATPRRCPGSQRRNTNIEINILPTGARRNCRGIPHVTSGFPCCSVVTSLGVDEDSRAPRQSRNTHVDLAILDLTSQGVSLTVRARAEILRRKESPAGLPPITEIESRRAHRGVEARATMRRCHQSTRPRATVILAQRRHAAEEGNRSARRRAAPRRMRPARRLPPLRARARPHRRSRTTTQSRRRLAQAPGRGVAPRIPRARPTARE
jgi:hypothetical protein